MRAVNLLPQVAIRAQPGLPNKLRVAAAAAVPVLALILVIVGYWGAHAAVSAKRSQLEAARAAVASHAPTVPVPVSPSPSTAGLVALRAQRRAALDDVLSKQVPWDTTLRELAQVLPASVWLTDLTATSPTRTDSTASTPAPTTGAATTTFTINGFTYSQDEVALLLHRLELLPTLSSVTLASTTQATIGKNALVQFQVTAAVQPAHPGSQR